MISSFAITKKRFLVLLMACTVLIAGILVWQIGEVTEAAILDPHPGLVGWWRFDEGNGTIVEDSSGNGNDGAIYGVPTWSEEGKYGAALSFDGVDNYVEVTDDPMFHVTENVTLEAWVKRNATQSDDYGIIVMKDWNYLLYVSKTGVVRYGYRNTDGAWQTISSAQTIDEEWHHIVGTRTVESGNLHLYLYIDGVLSKDEAKSKLASDLNAPVRIGHWTTTAYRFKGLIDEVHVYNRTLSGSEIENLFQRGPGFSSKLSAKLPKNTEQFIATLSWLGQGSVSITIESPSETYTEEMMNIYEKTVYSSSNEISDMLNMKRAAITVSALLSEENWNIYLEFDNVEDYQITIEVQT